MQRHVLTLVGLLGLTVAVGCGADKLEYTPQKDVTDVSANLPAVPNLPKKPMKDGEAYTVWGASYSLRSKVYRNDVDGKTLSITGYIVKTNLADVDPCFVHPQGKADPENCRGAELPTFWIADSKDAKIEDAIQVVGWARNFAVLYDAIEEYDKAERAKKDPEAFNDDVFGVKIPFPLPAAGAKVTVKGTYGPKSTTATGMSSDPLMGIITYTELTYQEAPSERVKLPGMK